MTPGRFSTRAQPAPLAEMNVVPLVDVMLVLLVVFIVTAPLLTHAVKLDLPRTASNPDRTRSERIELAIRADGTVFWNGELLAGPALAHRLMQAGARRPQPELHLRADRDVRYDHVALAMSAAARAGLTRVALLTDPAGAVSPAPTSAQSPR